MQSLSDLVYPENVQNFMKGFPENVQNFMKAELAKPFYYLEFGQDE